jgi:hypothetical protein
VQAIAWLVPADRAAAVAGHISTTEGEADA